MTLIVLIVSLAILLGTLAGEYGCSREQRRCPDRMRHSGVAFPIACAIELTPAEPLVWYLFGGGVRPCRLALHLLWQRTELDSRYLGR